MSSSTSLPPFPFISSAVGITFSALFSGGVFTNSYVGIPPLLLANPKPPNRDRDGKSPSPVTSSFHLTRQWHHFFERAKFVFPKLALTAGAGYGVAAYCSPTGSPARPYFWGAMATALAIFPFTALIMPTNWRLMPMGEQAEAIAVANAKGGEKKGTEDDERWKDTADLIAKWGKLNFVRAAIPLVAIAIAVGGLLA